jgi:hypothetical protein
VPGLGAVLFFLRPSYGSRLMHFRKLEHEGVPTAPQSKIHFCTSGRMGCGASGLMQLQPQTAVCIDLA